MTKKNILLKNTFFLYILVFSSYFFSFITVPYQTRILGPDYYGRVGFSLAFMTYFKLFIDFGFLLSSTEEVAKNRGDNKKIREIVSAVNCSKLILTGISLVLVLLLCFSIDKFKSEITLYIITFFSVAIASFIPDFLFRGLEEMKTITYRVVAIQAFSTIMIFFFVKNKSDYYLIPLFSAIGNLIALISVYYHAYKKYNIYIIKVNLNYVLQTMKESSSFFYSRIATTAYTAANTFIIGMVYPVGSQVVGHYTSADKLVGTGQKMFSPIADSLYPYMVKNKDFKLLKKIIFAIMIPVILGSVIIMIYAEVVVVLLLGEEFREAGIILRMLMPIVILTPLNYILGFPVLSPMGLAKYANLSTIYASIFHVLGLLLLFFSSTFSIKSLSYLTVTTNAIIVIFRIVVIWKNKDKFTLNE